MPKWALPIRVWEDLNKPYSTSVLKSFLVEQTMPRKEQTTELFTGILVKPISVSVTFNVNSLSRIQVRLNKEMPTTLLVDNVPEAFNCFQSSLEL